ncbi:hypothetical protein QJS04_geneDACA010788 [Acorus gramineus]|uniref:Uncharacterized protein n=1 Tax=Acorus gramineus TaxID=55184 RepID=A0AAV9BD69_ACOGR|nr:hypothetical protein QJS04_geneDACA010788 [Acorus gramineus]
MNSSKARVVTGITVSVCSLLYLALLRKATRIRDSSHEKSIDPVTDSRIPPGFEKKKKKMKKVSFSEEVMEPVGSGAEYRKRGRKRERRGDQSAQKRGAAASLPANRSVLYNGLHQYRSNMATFMIYA